MPATTSYIALLRGVNVGGKRKVPMAELQAAFVAMGFADARTLLNSGNIVFRSTKRTTTAALEVFLEREILQRLVLPTEFHVRTGAEWRAIIDGNPLPAAAAKDPSHYLVHCMKIAPSAEAVESLRAANPGKEVIMAAGRELYLDFGPAMTIAETKLVPALMDRKLGTRGTGRNWNTVLRLAALAGV